MPQFFLNIHQGDLASLPRLVSAHKTVEAVRREAQAIFCDLARTIVTGSASIDWQMEVREDTGQLVYRIKLSAHSPAE